MFCLVQFSIYFGIYYVPYDWGWNEVSLPLDSSNSSFSLVIYFPLLDHKLLNCEVCMCYHLLESHRNQSLMMCTIPTPIYHEKKNWDPPLLFHVKSDPDGENHFPKQLRALATTCLSSRAPFSPWPQSSPTRVTGKESDFRAFSHLPFSASLHSSRRRQQIP